MTIRNIIKIDENRCNGCAACIPNCPEGAIRIIDGKARLVSDLFCDGLGACLGHCPQGAITIEARQAQPYDERKVMERIAAQGSGTIKAHLHHLKEHKEPGLLKEALDFLKEKNIPFDLEKEPREMPCGCPGAKTMDFRKKEVAQNAQGQVPLQRAVSQLQQWPVQLALVAPMASYLEDSEILIAADCVPFAYANFHQDFLKGKALLVGCPKLDDTIAYQKKLAQIFTHNTIKSVTYCHMEVPCCSGLIGIIQSAIAESGKKIPFKEVTISIRGDKIDG